MWVENLKSTLGLYHSFVVSNTGRSGGMDVFLNNKSQVQFLPYSQYHIDAIATEGDSKPWRLTRLYGEVQLSE